MFIVGDRYKATIQKLLATSKSADLAIAFIGRDAERLLPKDKRIRLICNLESGATHPGTIRALRDEWSNVTVKSLNNVHAKVAICDGVVLAGSANLSSNGLGLEPEELAFWHEAALESRQAAAIKDARDWFEELWKYHAHPIDDLMLDAAEAAQKRRSQARPHFHHGRFFDALMRDWAFVKNRPIHLVVTRDESSAAASTAFKEWKAKQTRQFAKGADCYEEWPEIPNATYLLEYSPGARGGIEYCGLWWTGDPCIHYQWRKTTIQIVHERHSFLGLKLTKGEGGAFGQRIKRYLQQLLDAEEVNNEGLAIPLHEALEKMRRIGLAPVPEAGLRPVAGL
jgi:hypothetical protein